MQIREQWKESRNWKLVTGAAAAATLGLGALVIAMPGGADQAPPSISLDERAEVGGEATAGGFVPFDLSTFTGLHADRDIYGDSYFGGGFFWTAPPLAAEGPAAQAGPTVAPPVTDGAVGAPAREVSASDDADETTSTDVLSEGVDAADDDVAGDAVTEGPAVTIGDDSLSGDSLSGDSFSDDAADPVADDSPELLMDDSLDSDDSFDDDSLDSDDSDDSLDSPDDSN
jgi:hypothetical protein